MNGIYNVPKPMNYDTHYFHYLEFCKICNEVPLIYIPAKYQFDGTPAPEFFDHLYEITNLLCKKLNIAGVTHLSKLLVLAKEKLRIDKIDTIIHD